MLYFNSSNRYKNILQTGLTDGLLPTSEVRQKIEIGPPGIGRPIGKRKMIMEGSFSSARPLNVNIPRVSVRVSVRVSARVSVRAGV